MVLVAMSLPSGPFPELSYPVVPFPVLAVLLVPCLVLLAIRLAPKGPVIKGVPGSFVDLYLCGVSPSSDK